jgi:hypothetical protein
MPERDNGYMFYGKGGGYKMTAEITFVDGTTIKEKCCGFNSWSSDEIILFINKDVLPIVRHEYPKSLIHNWVMLKDDGSIVYKGYYVDEYIKHGHTDKDGNHVNVRDSTWKPEKIKEYLDKGNKEKGNE